MKKIGLNLVSRILIYIRATSFSIVILWMVFEIELIQNYGHTKQLQDWIFTLFFCIFFISATGLIILRLFDETKIKKDIARRIITFCLIFTFITCHRFDLTMKDYYYGQKIKDGLKYYFNEKFIKDTGDNNKV